MSGDEKGNGSMVGETCRHHKLTGTAVLRCRVLCVFIIETEYGQFSFLSFLPEKSHSIRSNISILFGSDSIPFAFFDSRYLALIGMSMVSGTPVNFASSFLIMMLLFVSVHPEIGQKDHFWMGTR